MMDEKALLQRANEERERLFQRYEHGREPGAEIDPWEDPGFEVYHQTDRYGFIHDKRLPQKIDQNEIKLRSIEMERVKKWLKMLKNWNSKDTQDKLHKRIYKGIPDKLRSQVWMKLLNIEKIMSENKNIYQNMLKLARQWSTEARQIDSDVNRQFREHLFYRERYSIKQRSLFNVLTAYSMYNMEVGYCQGMSGVAGVLLMYMDEEEAFWALSILLSDKKYAMHGLYIEGFPKLNRLVQHHDRIIEKFLPKLKKHFDLHNLDSMIYSLKWFFVIFIERIPFSLCLRVWDIYLLDGERIVTAMAYNILKLHQKKLLKLKDMDLLVQYLQTKLHKDFGYDDDHVIKMLEQSFDELRKAKMDYAPPPPDTEFPQRPFGIFIEPTIETKIGRRKSNFTETEKEVTENVIMRREKTQQEIAESTISDGGIEEGSNSQLNTAKLKMHEENWNFISTYKKMPPRMHALDKRLWSLLNYDEQYSSLPTKFLHGNIPESEDGGSLLGSSRKSLADTSITSTADLSVFSTGQRSQQFDICIDDIKSIRSDADREEEGGESSPGSAFGSLSIVGRTPSAMMITPTPRAMSPHDIVRIYVPPAPPDEIRSKSRTSSIPSTTSSPSNKLGNKSRIMTGREGEKTTTTATSCSLNNDDNNHNGMIISNSNNLDDEEDDTITMTMMMAANTSTAAGTMTSSLSNHNNFYDNSNGSSSSKRNSIVSGEITPIRHSFIYKSDEDFITTATTNGGDDGNASGTGSGSGGSVIKSGVISTSTTVIATGGGGRTSTSSSSRRGSLSRKSPPSPPPSSNIIDCEHIRNKRRSTSSMDIPITPTSTTATAISVIADDKQQQMTTHIVSGDDDENDDAIQKAKVMTSFEELAKLRKQQQHHPQPQYQQRHYHHHHQQQRAITTTTSDDDDFSPKISKKTKSKYDYNKCSIKYKELSQSQSSIDILDYHHHNQSSDDAIFSSNTNKNFPTKIKKISNSSNSFRKKSDTTTNSDDNECYSSSSPIKKNLPKSVLTTPTNDQQEILPLSLPSSLSLSQIKPSLSSSSCGILSASTSATALITPQSPSSSVSSTAAVSESSSPSPISPTSSTLPSTAYITSSKSTQNLINFGDNSGDETTSSTLTEKQVGENEGKRKKEILQMKAKTMTINNDDGNGENLMTTSNKSHHQHQHHYRKKTSTNRSSTSDDDTFAILKPSSSSKPQPPPPPPVRAMHQRQYQYEEEMISSSGGGSEINKSYGIEKFRDDDHEIRQKNFNIRPKSVVQQQQHHQLYIDENESSPKGRNKMTLSTSSSSTTPYTTGNKKMISSSSNSNKSSNNKKHKTNKSNNSSGNNVISSHSYSYSISTSSHSPNKNQRYSTDDEEQTFHVAGVSSSTITATVASETMTTTTTATSNIDFDRRIAAPLGGSYDYKNHHHHHHNTTAKDMNKIRIKVQQNQ